MDLLRSNNPILTTPEKLWENCVLRKGREIKSVTCKIYNDKTKRGRTADRNPEKCPCGRLVRSHSFTGPSLEEEHERNGEIFEQPPQFKPMIHRNEYEKPKVYGVLPNSGCKFLRLDVRTSMEQIYNLLQEDCHQEPDIIISIYGGARFFTMTERIQKEFLRGIIGAASVSDAWILTHGLNNGISKLVCEAIAHQRLLNGNAKRVTCIGLTMWSAVNERTRMELKTLSKPNKHDIMEADVTNDYDDTKPSIEPNHTHCFLFDEVKLNGNLSDYQRDALIKVAKTRKPQTFCSVTIIVDGGFGTLEVIEKDIEARRPILLIQGSGRMADVISNLIESNVYAQSGVNEDYLKTNIIKALTISFPRESPKKLEEEYKNVKKVLDPKHKDLMHIFKLDRDNSISKSIFQAIFDAYNNAIQSSSSATDQTGQSERGNEISNRDEQIIKLALKWNHLDGIRPILESEDLKMRDQNSNTRKKIFEESLKQALPDFLDYLLNDGFDVMTLTKSSTNHGFIEEIHKKVYSELMNDPKTEYLRRYLGETISESKIDIDKMLKKLVGPLFHPLRTSNKQPTSRRIFHDIAFYSCVCCDNLIGNDNDNNIFESDGKKKQEMILRDLFLWCIFMDIPAVAKIFLFRLSPRICGALIASAVFKSYSQAVPNLDLKHKYLSQSLDFENYAATCIDQSYAFNQKRACELLLREVPLFGRVSCMQLAICWENRAVIETACFDESLNQIWYDKLSMSNRNYQSKLLQFPSLVTLGLLAPWIVAYRGPSGNAHETDEREKLSDEGISYYTSRCFNDQIFYKDYWKKFQYFHSSPCIKMYYHFILYIWFLLVFSYMLLYNFDPINEIKTPDWTEIYVIITVSMMLCEDIRIGYWHYKVYGTERWKITNLVSMSTLKNSFLLTPYILFYIGIGIRFGDSNQHSIAKILLAFDLELWYLKSMMFVIALKYLGPKLFMLQNMLRDLFAFVYMIFVAIIAYGVVSRSLISYKEVAFTGQSIFAEILYKPYWFMFGDTSDKDTLDVIITNGTPSQISQATATHVLLAFHMLFINILLLNLIIAVFADSIGKVQEKAEFYWRYQRYSFVRNYFEQFPFAFPPLTLIFYFVLIIRFLIGLIYEKCIAKGQISNGYRKLKDHLSPRVFKMIFKDESRHEMLNMFETAATYSCTRQLLRKNKFDEESLDIGKSKSDNEPRTEQSNVMLSEEIQPQRNELTNDMNDIYRRHSDLLTQIQDNSYKSQERMEKRLDELVSAVRWMMDAIERVKMNDPKRQRPDIPSLGPVGNRDR